MNKFKYNGVCPKNPIIHYLWKYFIKDHGNHDDGTDCYKEIIITSNMATIIKTFTQCAAVRMIDVVSAVPPHCNHNHLSWFDWLIIIMINQSNHGYQNIDYKQPNQDHNNRIQYKEWYYQIVIAKFCSYFQGCDERKFTILCWLNQSFNEVLFSL